MRPSVVLGQYIFQGHSCQVPFFVGDSILNGLRHEAFPKKMDA